MMTDVLDWDALVRETKRRRDKEKLTQLKHAQLAGVSRDTIRSFDRYDRSISLEKAIAILRVVGLVSETDNLRHAAGEQADFVRRSLERWNELTRPLPKNHPSCFPHGKVSYSYQVQGELEPISGQTLLKILADVPAVTGWPPFHVFSKQSLRPVVEIDDEIECWVGRPGDDRIFADAPHADYWRASPQGSLLLLRGYQEDGDESQEPGAFLDVALPLWRAADVLDHALDVARRFPGKAERVVLLVTWDGLAGRRLVNWSRPTAIFLEQSSQRSRVPSVTNAVTVETGVDGVTALSLRSLMLPLYAAFDTDLQERDIASELSRRRAKSAEIVRVG
jgi:transcriptional regulator with XRE-family HTH domain